MKMHLAKNSIFLLLVVFISCMACIKSNRYEKEYHFANQNWSHTDTLDFQFNIKDTSVGYDMLFLVKHTYDYAYSNIWIKMLNTNPIGRTDTLSLEIPLALPTDGEWLGRRVNEIAMHRANIGPNGAALRFKTPGTYKIRILQDMRSNELENVWSAGLALEKTVTGNNSKQ